jgi:3-phosphoshikimate 1-carboxyvinyltransferase
LISEDVKAAIKTVRKLGIKVKFKNKFCKIYGKGINGFNYKKT